MNLVYGFALLLSAAIAAWLTWFGWRRRPAAGAASLAALGVAEAWWSFTYALSWFFPDALTEFAWLVLRWAGTAAVPTLLLIVVVEYTGRRSLLSRRALAFLAVEPVVTFTIIATDPLHDLFLGGKAATTATFTGGPWYWIHTAAAVLLLLASAGLIIQKLVDEPTVYRRQAWFLLAAVITPGIVGIAQIAGLQLSTGLNASPIAYSLSGLVLAVGLFSTGAFEVIPIARGRLLQQIPDGVVLIDAEGRLVDANPAARHMGVIEGDPSGRPVREVFARWSEAVDEVLGRYARGEEDVTVTVEAGDGRILDVRATLLRDARDVHVGSLLVVRDVTEVRSLNRELAARTEQLARELDRTTRVLDAIGDGVCLLDGDLRLLAANASADRVVGVPLGRWTGRRLDEAVSDLGVADLAAAARSRGSVTTTAELPGGRILHVEAIPLPGPAGSGNLIVVLRDETERHALEQLRQDFVANVSHELQTPITVLSLIAETLPRVIREDPAEADRFLGRLAGETARLRTMTDSLLTLSRLDEGEVFTPTFGPVDVGALAAEAVAQLEPLAEDKGIAVGLARPAGLEVRGDAETIRAMIANLLQNAIRYTDPGGRVDVEVAAEADAEGAPWAVVRVRDTGVGIAAADLERIFDRFYRVDRARSRATGGSGLGLAIVRHGAELHGGSVGVVSEVGVGSTFTIRLPAGSGAAGRDRGVRPAATAARRA